MPKTQARARNSPARGFIGMDSGNGLNVLTLETVLFEFLLKTGFIGDSVDEKNTF